MVKNALIPSWALQVAGLTKEEVITWVAGKRSQEWFPPVFMLTEKEIVWIDRGLFSKTQHRVPRTSVRSVSYKQGLLTDNLIINVAGGDFGDTGIALSKDHRERAQLFMAALRQQLTS